MVFKLSDAILSAVHQGCLRKKAEMIPLLPDLGHTSVGRVTGCMLLVDLENLEELCLFNLFQKHQKRQGN